jgi:ABC-2 type transport system ATP-binding protein
MLAIDRLTKRFGDIVALDDASFSVSSGRIVGFLGPNGAGKTTAMRCIFGLAEPDSGHITWNGRPLSHDIRLRFGYMPEERGLYPKMRVHEQLVYFGRLSRMRPAEAAHAADRWLDRLGLSDRASSRLDELSHGNQQRIQLAVALIHDPELLVLDEPFSGLDPIGVANMSGLLSDMAAQETGIVFSSHQLDLVEDICDDVVIIDHGRVVLSGSVTSLKSQSDRVRIEIGVDDAPWVPPISGAIEVARDRRFGSVLVPKGLDLRSLLDRASEAGEVTSFSYGPPQLSDLFLEAVES